ncbi:unnamed protein product [Rhizoctonia solani]|nr:unnamed protein product [Rhizoctonia solani]
MDPFDSSSVESTSDFIPDEPGPDFSSHPVGYLVHYMRLFYQHQGDWEPKSAEELNQCLFLVRNYKDRVSVSELETILRSARTWQLFEHFTHNSFNLITHFMELLKLHCESYLLFRYHGFLCFQLLTSVILAGVIKGCNTLERVFNYIQTKSNGKADIAYHVADLAASLLERGTMVHPQHHEQVFSSYFVASHLEGDYVLLPELGGFRREDAVWLLGELWEDRKSFLQFSGSGLSSMMHGWSVVFAAMWRHIEKLQDSPELLKKLRNLLLRYALSAFNPEFKLVCNIVLLIEDQAPSTTTGYEELPPVDTDDADLILRLFMEYLNTEKRDIGPPPGDMMAFPFAMVYRTTLNTLPNQVPYFLVAVVERVWKMLGSTAPTLTLRERIVDSYEYGLNAIMSMCSALIFGDDIEPSLDAVSAWTKLLQEVNILELIGRLCSVAVVSSNSSASGFLICEQATRLV